MKKTKQILIFLLVFLLLAMPVVSFAQLKMVDSHGNSINYLVPCDNSAANPCGFNQLMTLINNVINFVLYGMVIPIAAILFTFAGFEMVTSGGSTEKRGMAKKVFTNVVIGLVIAMACWLIVKLLLTILGYNGAWIGF